VDWRMKQRSMTNVYKQLQNHEIGKGGWG